MNDPSKISISSNVGCGEFGSKCKFQIYFKYMNCKWHKKNSYTYDPSKAIFFKSNGADGTESPPKV